MRHGLRVLRAFLSLGVLNLVQYRSDFFIALLNALISLVTQVLALSVIFTATGELGGWGRTTCWCWSASTSSSPG